MSDLDLTKKVNVSRNQKNASSPQNLKDQMADAGADMMQRAAGDTARDKFQEATEAAEDMASDTADKLQDQVREQQHTGADFVNKFAGNIREAARAFENDVPFAARGIDSVAEYIEDAAEKIRNGSFRDLVDNATDFAKRRPAAFLGSPCSLVLLRSASSRRRGSPRHRGLGSGSTPRRLRMGTAGSGPQLRRTQVIARIRVLPHAASAVVTRVRVHPYRAPLGIRRHSQSQATLHEPLERYQNQPKRSSYDFRSVGGAVRSSPSCFRTRWILPRLNSARRFRRSAAPSPLSALPSILMIPALVMALVYGWN